MAIPSHSHTNNREKLFPDVGRQMQGLHSTVTLEQLMWHFLCSNISYQYPATAADFNNIIKTKTCFNFFIVKAAVLEQQISKFYPQIQRIEASDHIYFGQRSVNVKAIFCA